MQENLLLFRQFDALSFHFPDIFEGLSHTQSSLTIDIDGVQDKTLAKRQVMLKAQVKAKKVSKRRTTKAKVKQIRAKAKAKAKISAKAACLFGWVFSCCTVNICATKTTKEHEERWHLLYFHLSYENRVPSSTRDFTSFWWFRFQNPSFAREILILKRFQSKIAFQIWTKHS